MIKVIIPASGIGARMGADVPKQFLMLKGQHILQRTISVFENMSMVDEIVVAVPSGYVKIVEDYNFEKVRHIVEGGKSRADSVSAALKCLPADTEVVLIHDGVRPFVKAELVEKVADAAKVYGAAVACAPVTDTIKSRAGIPRHYENDPGLCRGALLLINATLDRSQLWSAQTPQGFTYDIIMRAYEQGEKDGFQATDDSSLVERLNLPVVIVPSNSGNIKITTAFDMAIGLVFLEEGKDA